MPLFDGIVMLYFYYYYKHVKIIYARRKTRELG